MTNYEKATLQNINNFIESLILEKEDAQKKLDICRHTLEEVSEWSLSSNLSLNEIFVAIKTLCKKTYEKTT